MIISVDIHFTVWGKELALSDIENDMVISFTEVERVGEEYANGRNKGKIIETSSATISSCNENYIQNDDEICRLALLASKISNSAKKYKVEESVFHIYITYAGQCCLSFDQKVLSALSNLNFVNIDCTMLFDSYETIQLSDSQELVKFYNNRVFEKEVMLNNQVITG